MLPINAMQRPLAARLTQSTLPRDNHSLVNQISHVQQMPESLNLNSSEISTENRGMSRSKYLIILKHWRDEAPTDYIKVQRNRAIAALLQCHTNQDPHLVLSNLSLQTLPILPPHITALKLCRLNLIALPELPSRLKELECANNQLRSLPELPSTLEKLNCSHNQLVLLPELPDSLTYLLASYNLLRELPIPSNNLLSENIVAEHQSLPNKPRTLLDSISDWFINPSTHHAVQKFSTIKNDENTLAFSQFLDRLSRTKRVKNNIEVKEQTRQWLTNLSDSPQLQEKTFLLAFDATGSCQDRVTLTWNLMKKAALVHDIEQGHYDNKLPNLIDMAREMFRLEKLEAIARKKIRDLTKEGIVSLAEIDEIEVYLAYQTQLHQDLQLQNVAKSMSSFDYSDVNNDDLASAALITKIAEDTQFPAWLAQWEPMHKVVERTAPDLWSSVKIDLDEYQRRFDNEMNKISEENNTELHNDTDLTRVLGQKIHNEMKKEAYEPLVVNYFSTQNQPELLEPKWELSK